jgi:hypothetical protein
VTAVIVQPMTSGVEMLAGVTWHRRFGHAVVCGAGGTLTEFLADSACRLTPLSEKDAGQMLDGLRSGRLLRGFRGSPCCDEASLRDVLLRLSLLAETCPQLRDIDLNPVFVGPHGARAADIRVRIASSI